MKVNRKLCAYSYDFIMLIRKLTGRGKGRNKIWNILIDNYHSS